MSTGQLATNGIDVPAGFVDMPKYKSHKTVWAVKIMEVVDQGTDTTADENPIVLLKFDKPYGDLRINLRGKPTPQASWYLVQYEDGYVSFSPAEQFEKGNTLITAEEASTFPVKMADLISLSLKVAERAPDLEISPDATVKSAIKMIERFSSVPIPVEQPFDMPPHQHRVLVEKSELEAKLGKLRTFFNSPTYAQLPTGEQDRLNEQAHIMDQYIAILRDRIEAF